MIGETGLAADPEPDGYFSIYEEGFCAYLARDFEAAAAAFKEALRLRPNDPAAGRMLVRIGDIDPVSMPADWDGAVSLTVK